ncbi:MAG: hypothetical protein RIK87_13270 [Fuerstiella sp.]
MTQFQTAVLSCCVFVGTSLSASAADSVSIVQATDAPPLEKHAAQELKGQLERLFSDITVTVSDETSPNTDATVLIGSPATNPQLAGAFPDWPKVSDQGIVIQSRPDRKLHAVGGGSPAATLWAAYELGYRLGIRYLPQGDVYPASRDTLKLESHNVVLEPGLRSRTWQTKYDLAIGPASWSAAEHKTLLRQLAKMKFNRLMLSVTASQPFVQYESGGVRKSTAALWGDEKFPLDGETVGKKAFGTEKLFENPDFAGLTTSEQRFEAGRKHLQIVIDAAQELGMTVGIRIAPCEFPPEFQPELKNSTDSRPRNAVPAGEQNVEAESLHHLAAAKILAYLKTYPTLDTLYVSVPEISGQSRYAEEAREHLKQHGLTITHLVRAADSTTEAAQQAVRQNLNGLAFLRSLFNDPQLLTRPDGSKIELVIDGLHPALFSVLDKLIPPDAGTLNSAAPTARRSALNTSGITQVPATTVSSQLIMTLGNDNAGILPQSALQHLGQLTDTIRNEGWSGFCTQLRVPGELDPAVYFLSQAAWHRDLTPEQAVRELWTTTTGNESAADRLWKAWQHLETATDLIDEHGHEFAFARPGMLMDQFRQDPLPEWWQKAADEYTAYMVELYRSHGAIDGNAKPILFYYAKRSEFALEFMNAVKAVREAALAKQDADTDAVMEQMETALEQTYNCINTLSDVARDQSDRGVIAILNSYAWRPLLAKMEELEN